MEIIRLKILIIGAAGMIGRKLVERLVKDGALGGAKIGQLDLVDIVEPTRPAGAPFATTTGAVDIAAAYVPPKLIAEGPDAIFLLASIVSGEAEKDFDKGYAINLDGTRNIFEAIRQRHLRTDGAYRPRVIFTSSIAVYGAPFPAVIDDEFFSTPLTSYGTQKAISELLLSDYSRRGFFEGVGIRLPTICVRPGKPNLAASGFFSNIIRLAAICRRLPHPCGDDGHRAARRPPQPDDARRLGDSRRADRGVAPDRGRGRGEAHPATARRDDRPDRCWLANQFLGQTRLGPWIYGRGQF